MPVKNQVQLITYPDSMGGDLKALKRVLDENFNGVFKGGIHLLPPYPSSGDRGFAPIDYFKIDPKFGDWQDVKALAIDYDILLDFMVNHISKSSHFFQDYLQKGNDSEYEDMFLPVEKIWPDGISKKADIDKMFLRRELPYSTYKIGKDGLETKLWTTFGKTDPSEQIDLDVHSPKTKAFFKQIFKFFKEQNIRIIRLDAVGYVIKKLGTSCFFVEPDIYDFLKEIKDLADSYDIDLLPEVHATFRTQYKLAKRGFWIYDFILPYYILEALIMHNSDRLYHYLKIRPSKQFTMLDCHDGIPIKPDLDDLVSSQDARKVVNHCMKNGANLSLIYSDKYKSPDGFDVHQIRCTIYSALGENEKAYIQARAIQLFTPGIPQVYYVGLLAGANDMESVERTGEGREINRYNFTEVEINEAVKRPVVKSLLKLIRLRNEHSAFEGNFSVSQLRSDLLVIEWVKNNLFCTLKANLTTYNSEVTFTDDFGNTKNYEF